LLENTNQWPILLGHYKTHKILLEKTAEFHGNTQHEVISIEVVADIGDK